MFQKLKEPVSVWLAYDSKLRRVMPEQVQWQGRLYPITKVGLHHYFRTGRTLYHVFSVTAGEIFLRLVLNTDNLHWTLEEISDGLTN